MKSIIFGGGCFWGVEEYFRRLKGVSGTVVGYAQGHLTNPSYEDVLSQISGHREVCVISYREDQITLSALLEHLFRIIDPTIKGQQANDIGDQYQSGIYYVSQADADEIQMWLAKKAADYSKPLAVEVQKLQNFYHAEEYHQQYLRKNPNGYCHVDFSSIQPFEKKE